MNTERALNTAAHECCTTDCGHYANGTCPFWGSRKADCPTIKARMAAAPDGLQTMPEPEETGEAQKERMTAEMTDALRDFLMNHAEELQDGLHAGIDSSGIAERMAHYIMRRLHLQ